MCLDQPPADPLSCRTDAGQPCRHDPAERSGDEQRRASISSLVARLNEVESAASAARAIADAADELLGWDAFSFDLYSLRTGRAQQVLNFDLIDGRRTEVPPAFMEVPCGSLTARAIAEGPKLVPRRGKDETSGSVPFGDKGRRSESYMIVPVHGRSGVLAIVSVHSYTPGAYDEAKLAILQEICAHCSAALQRIRAHIELAANEQRIRTLVEALPVAVVIQQDGKVIFANPATVCLLRAASLTEIIGAEILDFVAPESRAQAQVQIERALAGGRSPWMEMPIRRADESEAFVQLACSGIQYSDRPAVQIILLDITDRKKSEERQAVQYAATRVLAQSTTADTLEQFLETVRAGSKWKVAEIWVRDPITGTLRLAAASHDATPTLKSFCDAGRALGFRKGEGLPGDVWESGRTRWSRDVMQESYFVRRRLAASAGLHGAVSFPIFVREEFAGLVSLFQMEPAEEDTGMLELFNVLGTQLGQFLERKGIQEQLLQVQKMEAIGQLAGGVAHDFNNLLTVIAGRTQLALSIRDLPAGVADDLKEISTAVNRATTLTRQLLTFSRKQVMERRTLQIETLVNELTKMLRRIIGEHIALRISHAPALPPIEGDSGMLENVLVNMAVNARDAMSRGGDLRISTSTVEVDAAKSKAPEAIPGTYVCIEVSDTGCGMSPYTISRIFEPFFTTKPAGQGTGLGLATAYGIMKQHRGWIEVESQIGAGSTFRLYFPASTNPALANPSATRPAPAERGAGELILLVEDEASVRSLARRLLERHGYRVVEAESGVHAMEAWAAHAAEVRLVLSDMVMPGGMSGKDLARELRARNPSLTILFSSGYTNELSDGFLENERCRFIAKPYTPQQLLETVAEALKSEPAPAQ